MQPAQIQSHLRFPLTRLLANGGSVRVLRAMMLYGAPLSVSQIAQDTGLTPQGVRLTLNTLTGQQVVTLLGASRSQLFEINTRHPLTSALKRLFKEEQAHWESIMQSLQAIFRKIANIEAAWYYGSVARAEDSPESDLDIAIIITGGSVDDTVESARLALRELEDSSAVNCSIVGVALDDVPALARENAWWQEVTRDAKVIKGPTPARLASKLKQATA
jgi:predicted nucleotidyltransferase